MTELTVAQCVAPADVLRRLISFGEPEFGEADLADGSIRVTSNYEMRLQSR